MIAKTLNPNTVSGGGYGSYVATVTMGRYSGRLCGNGGYDGGYGDDGSGRGGGGRRTQ